MDMGLNGFLYDNIYYKWLKLQKKKSLKFVMMLKFDNCWKEIRENCLISMLLYLTFFI